MKRLWFINDALGKRIKIQFLTIIFQIGNEDPPCDLNTFDLKRRLDIELSLTFGAPECHLLAHLLENGFKGSITNLKTD